MAKKKKQTRVAFNDNASVISDISANTTPSVNEVDAHTESDTESTVTSKKSSPKIKFKSTPPPKKSNQVSKVNPRGQPSKRVTNSRNKDDSAIASARRKKTTQADSQSMSSSTGSEAVSAASRDQSASQNEHKNSSLDQDELLSRISTTIPDLHLILDKYKATHGEISLRDSLRRRFEAQAIELVKSKDGIISALMSQLEEAARQRADETSRFRSRITALELSQAQIKEQARIAEMRAKHAEEHHRRLMIANEQLVAERTIIIRRINEDREKALKRQEKELNEKHEQKLNRLKKHMEEQKESHNSEVQDIKEKHDSDLSTQKDDLETKLSKAEDDIKELEGTDLELKDRYELEWKEKEEELVKKYEEEIQALRQYHKDYCNDQIRGFLSLQESLNKALTEENTALKELVNEYKSTSTTTKVEDAPESG